MARTIRICSLSLLALAANVPAFARRAPVSPLGAYFQARALDAAGDAERAATAYAAALTASPGDTAIAARAFAQAIAVGDKVLALRAAAVLDANQRAGGDVQLLLLIAAVDRGDWSATRARIRRIEATGFDFLAPSLGAWVSFGADENGATGQLPPAAGGLASAYAKETQILLLLARKQVDQAVQGLRLLSATDGRQSALRLAAGARLAALGRRDDALAVLNGPERLLRAARARLAAGRPIDGQVTTASQGIAFLLSRVAADLGRDAPSSSALSLARLAHFADPASAMGRLVLARALGLAGQHDAALEQLATIDGIAGTTSGAAKIELLARAGRSAEALLLAEAEAALPDATDEDFIRWGDALARADRHREAAQAYKRAIDAAGEATGWQGWLAYGSALDQAGDWPGAKVALNRAVALAPEQPAVLNHLGYAMLERRDDLNQATRLIAKASVLQPESAAVTDSLGWAFYLRGQTAEAIALLERASAGQPREAAIGDHLGDAYWTAGRRVEARYAWNAALSVAEGDADKARISIKLRDGLPAK